MPELCLEEGKLAVIGAGLPRTGTMSLKFALEILLGGNCYHMTEMMRTRDGDRNDHFNLWHKAMDGKTTTEDWRGFFRKHPSYRAGVDAPISLFYKELIVAFPDAKIILSDREPERWYESVKNTIRKITLESRKFPMAQFISLVGHKRACEIPNRSGDGWSPMPDKYPEGFMGAVDAGEERAVDFYNDWVAEVKRTVPKDRLLVFQAKEGWKPLCEFLGLKVPEEAFPKVNETQEMLVRLRKSKIISWIVIVGLPILISSLTYIYFFS